MNLDKFTDRAKEALFDLLADRVAGARVLDLFAGSGALGLEALSRGARYCLFVERHHPTAALIRGNLDTLGVVGEADVIEADASRCEFPEPPAGQDPADGLAGYELVFVDPPYRTLTGPKPDPSIQALLQRLATDPVIAPDALIVVRHPKHSGGEPVLSPLFEWQRRHVGGMTLRFMSPRLADESDQEAP